MKQRKTQKLFLGALLATSVLSISSPADAAGFSNWLNDYFTFREEQKHLVAPEQELPPIEVTTPHYNEGMAKGWSGYYTRKDLSATNYMDESSKVMRPDPVKAQRLREEEQRRLAMQRQQEAAQAGRWPEQGYGYGQNGNISVHPADDRLGARPVMGYERIEAREHANWLKQYKGNIYVGEAGSNPYTTYDTGMNIGKKTEIGDPKRNWKHVEPRNFSSVTPRQGDFDYGKAYPNRAKADPMQGQYGSNLHGEKGFDVARSSGYYNPEESGMAEPNGKPPAWQFRGGNNENSQSNRNPGSYQSPYNRNGKLPDNYVVEQNDTLSGISNKDQIYGDWKLWPLIYDANRNQINDPDLIYPGQDLGIPRDSAEHEKRDARNRAITKPGPDVDFYDGR